MFQRGSLWSSIRTAAARALECGELQSIPTECEMIEERGTQFIVRVVRALARKGNLLRPNRDDADHSNPFLPYHPEMFVANVSGTHVCLLNKYNVVENHVLIVTRQFRQQETRLTLSDFAALWSGMAEFEGLGFYNSGASAGASQPHKHLQLVPLPLAPSGLALPIDPLLAAMRYRNGLGQIPAFSFEHAVLQTGWTPSQSFHAAARASLDGYNTLLAATGIESRSRRPEPYNLLITRQWMLMVPRTREFFGSISLNALAFAGTFLVHDRKQLEELRREGPMAALQHVTRPANSSA